MVRFFTLYQITRRSPVILTLADETRRQEMLWPLILPFQITCGLLSLSVIAFTILASPKNWKRIETFFLYSGIALLAFIPSCTCVQMAVDAVRFGDFSYASYDDIPDFRSQRYLPGNATDIRMRKHGNGCLARYKLPASDFEAYLDEQWKAFGKHSAHQRGDFHDEGKSFSPESFQNTFAGLGWDCPKNGIAYYSPSEGDGGGAKYYVDAANGVVFQRTGFW